MSLLNGQTNGFEWLPLDGTDPFPWLTALDDIVNVTAGASRFVLGGLGPQGSGASVASFVLFGLSPNAAAGVACTTTSWTGNSLQESLSPAVAIGDIFYADAVTVPGGYPITVNGDGTVVIDAHGDTTRQRFQANIFDTSLNAYYGAFTVFVNNVPPQVNVQPPDIRVLVGQAISPVNFTSIDPLAIIYVLDQNNDVMTSAITAGSMPGITLAGNAISGTAASALQNDVTVRFIDVVGETKDVTYNYFADVGARVPNVVGGTDVDAITALTALGLNIADTSTYSANAAPLGTVLSQDTAPNTLVFTGSDVALDISAGSGGSGGPGGSGRTIYWAFGPRLLRY